MHRVVALALPDVVAFDLSIPSQVFGRWAEPAPYSFEVCGPQPGPVPTTTGFSVQVTRGLEALAEADTVVVPGYVPNDCPADEVCEALRAAADRGARLMSVCTGAFALAGAGLLDGRGAATHWAAAAELAASYPAVDVDPDVLFVDTGQILTSAGLAAGIDLCIHVVRQDHGAAVAAGLARAMVVAPYRDGGQAQFLTRPLAAAGDGLASTCEWMVAHLADPLTVDGMARHAGWARRTFARRFLAETGTTPLRWLAAQRLDEARRLLETTDLSVEQIAGLSGLGSGANLRLHFSQGLGVTPTAYRRTYQGASA
ncbi:MAG TPA: helix-turn-helix domain-containing protein [Nocardioides sp.]|jgi:AraC family transcriptional activator FtrA|uniref:GlxA family transcriptional regulator n=1 Tax=Nocardioides sp. TaxID=35761 RepID=UPI002E3184CD|nr:helix-turn-helix domain-containing protein [Nocardioides sp.]HEX3930399.1 helix-turn-helix domain-containing protein [Nocardioides sp.]